MFFEGRLPGLFPPDLNSAAASGTDTPVSGLLLLFHTCSGLSVHTFVPQRPQLSLCTGLWFRTRARSGAHGDTPPRRLPSQPGACPPPSPVCLGPGVWRRCHGPPPLSFAAQSRLQLRMHRGITFGPSLHFGAFRLRTSCTILGLNPGSPIRARWAAVSAGTPRDSHEATGVSTSPPCSASGRGLCCPPPPGELLTPRPSLPAVASPDVHLCP